MGDVGRRLSRRSTPNFEEAGHFSFSQAAEICNQGNSVGINEANGPGRLSTHSRTSARRGKVADESTPLSAILLTSRRRSWCHCPNGCEKPQPQLRTDGVPVADRAGHARGLRPARVGHLCGIGRRSGSRSERPLRARTCAFRSEGGKVRNRRNLL